MRHNTERVTIGKVELTYLLIGALLLLLLGAIATRGQTQQPLYREYRGVRLGMTAAETRAKLGEPAMKSDDQDFYVVTNSETTQIVYENQKVVTISTDYTNGIGAPNYKSVVGEGLLERPDGSVFRMVMYNSQSFWVSYNKSASTVPVVTVTIGTIR
jgi:hypothetical protein